MGRITIFTVEDCVHCTRLTNSLQDQEIPFTEISLSSHPHKRPDMLGLTDCLAVPQVFFNERHVGGIEAAFHALEHWITDPTKTVQEHFQVEVGSFPDPSDPRLQPSTQAPVEPSKAPPRPKSDRITLPDKRQISVVTIMEKLKKILPCQEHKSKSKICKQSFTGTQAVKALRTEFKISKPKAVKFGEYLRQALIFQSVAENVGEFLPTEKCVYRLQCFQTPNVLNSYRVWNTPIADSDCMGVLGRLKRQLDKVEQEVSIRTRHNGKEVNYALVKTNKNFPIFEEAVCELQKVNLADLDANTTKAFGVNTYNLMIKYAFFKLGIGSTSRSRSAFFNGVKFNIGGEIFSFQDWEHGFMRGNRRAPYSLKPQFGRKDPRQACVMSDVDCRIHFALNCGAKSCPPMRTFTADGIEEELRIVSQAFCEDDNNVEINVKKRTLCLNKILSWYRVDFASSEKGLPVMILAFLRGEKRTLLQQLIDDGKPIHVSYKKYDWSTTDASDFVPFDSAVLRADIQRIGQFRRQLSPSLRFSQKSKATSTPTLRILKLPSSRTAGKLSGSRNFQ